MSRADHNMEAVRIHEAQGHVAKLIGINAGLSPEPVRRRSDQDNEGMRVGPPDRPISGCGMVRIDNEIATPSAELRWPPVRYCASIGSTSPS